MTRRKNGLFSNSHGGKTLTVNGVSKFFPPIRSSAGAYDSARTNGRGGQDRDDIDDETDADERDGELFGNLGRDEERELERHLGAAISDGLRRYKAARDKRRAGKDSDPSDHLDDFDPLDERRAEAAYRDRDGSGADEEILGQVPSKSVMNLRRTSADAKLGYDSRRRTREEIDSRPAQSVAGRQVRTSLADELDTLFGQKGRA